MMLKRTKTEFKRFFLLEFTKEIIRSTKAYRDCLIEKEIRKISADSGEGLFPEREGDEKRKEKIRNFVREQIRKESERLKGMKKEANLKEIDYEPTSRKVPSLKKPQGMPPPLLIPQQNLPWTVRDIRPFPRREQEELRLGKLDVLIRDPLVKTIECNGSDEKIIVTGAMGRKRTGIILDDEEIDYVIERFSSATKIPVSEGIFRVVFGKLSLSAVISEVVGSKFIIRKMASPPLQIPFESR